MTENKIDATLALRSEGRFLVGRDRVKLLEAVAEHGSISKAAKAVGFSYKAAWDAVNAINNLLPRPAFVTKAGGRSGGGAEITEEGRRLIVAFRRLEERLSQISTAISEEGLESQNDLLFFGLALKISARNVFQAVVTGIRKAPVDVEVTLEVSKENSIRAIVTNQAVEELGLVPGRRAIALVKSPFITLEPVDASREGGSRNRFVGTVIRRIDSEPNSQVLLDIGDGKTITAIVAKTSADDLAIKAGSRAAAVFKPSHVILAVD